MPLYEYECQACGHRFERIRKFSDPPLEVCPQCGGAIEKLVSSPAFHLKGSGWYATDYAKNTEKTGKDTEGAEKKTEDAGKGTEKAEKKAEGAGKDTEKTGKGTEGTEKSAGREEKKVEKKESSKEAKKETSKETPKS